MTGLLKQAAWMVVAVCASGCGYQMVHGGHDLEGPFAVRGLPARVPEAEAIAAAEAGARAELSRASALAPAGSDVGVVEVEVLRVDEESAGLSLTPGKPTEPFARGVRITVAARGRLRRAGAATTERDSGEVRASEVVLRAFDTSAGTVVREQAVRVAALRAGERVVRRLLGSPLESADP